MQRCRAVVSVDFLACSMFAYRIRAEIDLFSPNDLLISAMD